MLDVTAILAKHGIAVSDPPTFSSALEPVDDFGSNPGNLRMFRYAPPTLSTSPALMVVLHGCTQTAAGYDIGSGWSTLADRYGFALLFPEQQPANNPNGCFNWFQPADVRRGQGEVASIRNMIDRCQRDYAVDQRRIFVTGLSAGGAMTSAMLACYPEVFAGGAIIAGLPFGAAADVRQAFEMMHKCPSRPSEEWGDLVRQASPHKGPWPRVSVWHGGSDTTVVPANAREIIKQWANVHRVAETSVAVEGVDGITRRAWKNAAGDDVIECYAIPLMVHGAPLATGGNENQAGVAGPYMLEAGISSSYHIARFFSLAGDGMRVAVPENPPFALSTANRKPMPKASVGERVTGVRKIDIGAVIANALNAAGLTKSRD